MPPTSVSSSRAHAVASVSGLIAFSRNTTTAVMNAKPTAKLAGNSAYPAHASTPTRTTVAAPAGCSATAIAPARPTPSAVPPARSAPRVNVAPNSGRSVVAAATTIQ